MRQVEAAGGEGEGEKGESERAGGGSDRGGRTSRRRGRARAGGGRAVSYSRAGVNGQGTSHTGARSGERCRSYREILSSINNIPVSPVLPVRSPPDSAVSPAQYPAAVYIGYRDGATSVSIKRLWFERVFRERGAKRETKRGAKPNRRPCEHNRGKNKKKIPRDIYRVHHSTHTSEGLLTSVEGASRNRGGAGERSKRAPPRLGSAGRGRGHASRESVDSVRGIRRAMGKQAAHHGRRTGFTGSGARGRG